MGQYVEERRKMLKWGLGQIRIRVPAEAPELKPMLGADDMTGISQPEVRVSNRKTAAGSDMVRDCANTRHVQPTAGVGDEGG